MSALAKAFDFLNLLHQFQAVERVVPVLGTDRRENDVEHSYSLAMLAWYLSDTIAPTLNKELVIKYALVHDLVEVYAGDTYAHTTDEALRASKHQREEDARKKLSAVFPDFSELHDLIEHYEQRSDAESKYVYALDKFIPMLTMYTYSKERAEGWWKQHNVTFEQICTYKDPKIATSPEVDALWKELRAILKQEKDLLFSE